MYRANGYDARNQPSFPEGFPSKMLVYHWFKRNANYHPREVDELYLDELEWLPICEEATHIASEEIAAQQEFLNNRNKR